jgi:hypothetical protein
MEMAFSAALLNQAIIKSCEYCDYPDSVDSDQGLAVVSLRVLMNCCS